jgi:hypothetical protein
MVTAILAGSTVAARKSPGQRGRKDDHVRRPLLWLLLAGLAIALLFLILHHEEGSVGSLSNGDFSSLTYGVALLVFLGGTALTLFRSASRRR